MLMMTTFDMLMMTTFGSSFVCGTPSFHHEKTPFAEFPGRPSRQVQRSGPVHHQRATQGAQWRHDETLPGHRGATKLASAALSLKELGLGGTGHGESPGI